MRKFAKISLAAAVAVAGLTSVASAKPLEEAIKGVDATGYVTYQYNDRKVKDGISSQTNIYKAAITLTVPATDDVAVKVTGVTRGVTGDNKAGTLDGDANPTTNIAHANFVYTGVEGLTVIAGKQAISTPWTEGSSHINATQSGTGILGLYNAGFATFAAAHFVNNNIGGVNNSVGTDSVDIATNDISVVAAIVPVMDVATFQVWYANIGEKSDSGLPEGAKALSASVDVNVVDVAKVSLGHATLKGKNDTLDKQALTKLVVSGNAGPVALAAGYARGGSNGSLVTFDSDASANFKGWDINAGRLNDPRVKAYLLKAGVDVMPALNLALTHVNAKVADRTVKAKETFGQVTYKFASNLSAYLRYGTQKVGDTKTTKGRLEVAFKF